MDNILYYGDNLEILERLPGDYVDLIYLDPPFNSKRNYNVIFAEKNGTDSVAQIKAFDDTWRWDDQSEKYFRALVTKNPGKISNALLGMKKILGSSNMMAYLIMMAPRLIEMRRVLKKTGSIYLHCDPTASHYLKILMDAIFGIDNFRNEIVWCYSRPSAKKQRQLSRVHDIIFWFSKSDNWHFNADNIRQPYAKSSLSRAGYAGNASKLTSGGLVELKENGKFPEDWIYISPLKGNSREYLGYPTQKPEALLERIILASCPENGIVLDPFCGCGTAISVAQRLKRRWVGIDITHLPINLIRHRLQKDFGNRVNYQVIGAPVCIEDAKALAQQDRYQFQFWALGLVGARPADEKKGPDQGIDGLLYFYDEKNKPKQIIIQVKSGSVNPHQIRDLRGVIERENAQIGVFITLKEPTRSMYVEASQAGFYTSPFAWKGKDKYPKMQILTIKELLYGKSIDYPTGTDITLNR
jgi:site-specific DNA-methyltransferase (adenine-specific)